MPQIAFTRQLEAVRETCWKFIAHSDVWKGTNRWFTGNRLL